MGQTSIILGNNTLTGVETLKLTDATDTTAKVDFTYGVTPSGTINVKLGDTTLTGVNEISVLGTDSTYKSFGYVASPSGYNVTIANHTGGEAGYCFYSLDGGTTWVDIGAQSGNINLTGVTQIMFKAANQITTFGGFDSTQLSLWLEADVTPEISSQNYILTQNITDVQAWKYND